MPEIAVLTPDLMFFSQVAETARRGGYSARQVERPEEVHDVDAVVVELRKESDPAALVAALRSGAPGARVYGFGPHVQIELLDSATLAGFDYVGRRSQLASQLPQLLAGER